MHTEHHLVHEKTTKQLDVVQPMSCTLPWHKDMTVTAADGTTRNVLEFSGARSRPGGPSHHGDAQTATQLLLAVSTPVPCLAYRGEVGSRQGDFSLPHHFVGQLHTPLPQMWSHCQLEN